MSMTYLAQTMTEDHPFRMVGFLVAKFATVGLVAWAIRRTFRSTKRGNNSAPNQPAPFYPPHANGPWGPPQAPYAAPGQPWTGQSPTWPPPHPAQHTPPPPNWYR